MKKTVVVTGGSHGIGRAVVEIFALNGYQVILNYNQSEKEAKSIEEKLRGKGCDVARFQADVSKRDEVERLAEFSVQKYGKIDVLVNNAGISQIRPFMETTEQDWQQMLQTNLTSVFYVCQEVLKHMLHEKQGSIINISSVWGLVGASCEVAYSAAKAGVDGLTKGLAQEFGLSNIRVNSIAPGATDTRMNQELTEEERKSLEEEIPLGRMAKPEEIASVVKWLAEDQYITGQVISPNGGWIIT